MTYYDYGYGDDWGYGADLPPVVPTSASTPATPVGPALAAHHTDITAPPIPGIQAGPTPTIPGVHTGLQQGVSGLACLPIYFLPFNR